MDTFDAALRAELSAEAPRLAAALFREAFNADFPAPRAHTIDGVAIAAADWRQFVARYRWPDGAEECVGFLNYIKFGDVYLGGGMCVKADFYRRLPRAHFSACKQRGGIAQILLDTAAATLTDAIALYGYCGDAKAFQVDTRAGYRPTKYPLIIVKPLGNVDPAAIDAATERVARAGPF